MDTNRIVEKMNSLQGILGYSFKDIDWLKEAMRAVKVADKKEHTNDRIALVGDALLKFVLSDYLYKDKEVGTKGGITTMKGALENNEILNLVVEKTRIIDYAYNDLHFYSDVNFPDHEKVADSKHSAYLEGIIAAIYYDGGYEEARKWIRDWLLPRLLEETKNNPVRNDSSLRDSTSMKV